MNLKIMVLIGMISCLASGCKHINDASTHIESQHDLNTDITTSDSIQSISKEKKELEEKGFELFDYVDPHTGDTMLMQKYFIVFLKRGPNRSQTKDESAALQKLHLEHLSHMYFEGFADISGPFEDDGDIKGITIYNVPTYQMADSLAYMDPMVKNGRLKIEIHPWWAAKGYSLR